MSHIAGFEDHGEFISDYKVHVNHEPWRERMVIYVRLGEFKDGSRLYRRRIETMLHGHDTSLEIVPPEGEPPLYLVIGNQEAEAIADAIRPRPQVNERHLDDAIDVRDRLMTIIESHQMAGLNLNDGGVNHITAEANARRSQSVR